MVVLCETNHCLNLFEKFEYKSFNTIFIQYFPCAEEQNFRVYLKNLRKI